MISIGIDNPTTIRSLPKFLDLICRISLVQNSYKNRAFLQKKYGNLGNVVVDTSMVPSQDKKMSNKYKNTINVKCHLILINFIRISAAKNEYR